MQSDALALRSSNASGAPLSRTRRTFFAVTMISYILLSEVTMIKLIAVPLKLLWGGTWLVSRLLLLGFSLAGKIMAFWRWSK
jgi:hypothetical protein